ncbi:MAG: hypothetical protein A3H71_02595 [Candidatus Sungbacteria bacterium RIFCSPLOWO2_02_FULL_48_13b]|uniref:Uncharacterized protein n=2 Tax=Candidatus Sungiibacteriota TaxID=1817917 RepID=A0A1G2LJF7_9BACT|nr:MAG: hypothetical protein A3C12_01935 [Candidatus Sungbacteria bacterium RIFCSPHIGHO2_02_FULL_49_20]OHA11763.1 MAG: hypothetical protein A3H71_02595 [Candidatus Sungbacteria bacterium RIFCSPLOWO2_02_FULL_48_13b]
MTVAIALLTCLILSGCGNIERNIAGLTGFSRMCIDGVSYLQFTSGVTVEYTREGKIKTCG